MCVVWSCWLFDLPGTAAGQTVTAPMLASTVTARTVDFHDATPTVTTATASPVAATMDTAPITKSSAPLAESINLSPMQSRMRARIDFGGEE